FPAAYRPVTAWMIPTAVFDSTTGVTGVPVDEGFRISHHLGTRLPPAASLVGGVSWAVRAVSQRPCESCRAVRCDSRAGSRACRGVGRVSRRTSETLRPRERTALVHRLPRGGGCRESAVPQDRGGVVGPRSASRANRHERRIRPPRIHRRATRR